MDVNRSYFYVTTGLVVIKSASKGRVGKLCVLASSLTTAVGYLYDTPSTVSVGVQNAFAVIPFTAGNYDINWAFNNGLVASVAPGQTIAISFE